MSQSISFFLPTRTGSERVINKNTRAFGPYTNGLIELKLKQLLSCQNIDEIVLSTNDPLCINIAMELDPKQKRIKIAVRPNHLCLSSTALNDLIKYVPTVCKYNHIMWGHVTTPFANSHVYDNAVTDYFKQLKDGYDSLISGFEHQNFLINPVLGEIVNYRLRDGKWPRTQDLDILFEVNHVMFINSKENYLKFNDRIGKNPYLYKMNKIASFDIDWEEDFRIAEAIIENANISL